MPVLPGSFLFTKKGQSLCSARAARSWPAHPCAAARRDAGHAVVPRGCSLLLQAARPHKFQLLPRFVWFWGCTLGWMSSLRSFAQEAAESWIGPWAPYHPPAGSAAQGGSARPLCRVSGLSHRGEDAVPAPQLPSQGFSPQPPSSHIPSPHLPRAEEQPGLLCRLLCLILHSDAQYFIIHLSEMYISLLRALLE